MANVGRELRHLRAHPCPVCGGFDEAPRGEGKRCNGFTSSDRIWCRCSREEHAGAIVAQDGLYRHKMRGACECGIEHAPGGFEPEATYDYRDEKGALLFQVVRLAGKEFRQRKPDGAGGWEWRTAGVRRVLYRLPELLASDPSATVYIVEGEKDVDAMYRRGFIATCNPGGAGKWRHVDVGPLKGRKVVVIADRDAPGRKHAAEVVAALNASALECPEKKDISDHFGIGGTLDQLVPMRADSRPSPVREVAAEVIDITGLTWKQALQYSDSKHTKLTRTLANAALILRNADEWKGSIGFDEFAGEIRMLSACPASLGGTYPRAWTDGDDWRTTEWLQQRWDLPLSREVISGAALLIAEGNRYDPLTKRLDGLHGDKTSRIDSWLIDYLGAPDTTFVRQSGRFFLLSAMARAYRPGAQVDHVLVLEGPQGARKSSALRELSLGYFAEEIADIGSKDAAMQLHGAWLIELSELEAITRSDVARVRAWVTRRADRYVPKYGRHVVDVPRRCVFGATTNDSEWLKDATGGRRWWPVPVGNIDLNAIRDNVEPLLAESRSLFAAGAHWWPETEEAHASARNEQESRYQTDEWESLIAAYLLDKTEISVADLLGSCLGIEKGRMGQAEQNRVARCLMRLKWKRFRSSAPGRPWVYRAGF